LIRFTVDRETIIVQSNKEYKISSQEHWRVCLKCKGEGKKRNRIRKKTKTQYQLALKQYLNTSKNTPLPQPPKGHVSICSECKGSGLASTKILPEIDSLNHPHVAIVGAGIGGVALAVACLHRGIPFSLFERDHRFDERSQGYGLTLQQASKALKCLGITSLKDGIISKKHVVHNTEGKVIAAWGMKKWLESGMKKSPKRTNIHIARQSLRMALIDQLGGVEKIQWGHQLTNFTENSEGKIELNVKVNGKTMLTQEADLIVGADGIRSAVRRQFIGEQNTPLRYLGCIVILGICPLASIKNIQSSLLDSETVFQTANGKERIYVMPFDSLHVMWQLSYPLSESVAKRQSAEGPKALKSEACRRTKWHSPIPEILEATLEEDITGYPVYDREILDQSKMNIDKYVTLIGDAAHPMSPFKGQGANQALLDALSLAKEIYKGCRPKSNWKEKGIRHHVLNAFEEEMINRSTPKVKDSAEAAKFLHSEVVLHEANEPRGKILKRK